MPRDFIYYFRLYLLYPVFSATRFQHISLGRTTKVKHRLVEHLRHASSSSPYLPLDMPRDFIYYFRLYLLYPVFSATRFQHILLGRTTKVKHRLVEHLRHASSSSPYHLVFHLNNINRFGQEFHEHLNAPLRPNVYAAFQQSNYFHRVKSGK